MHERQRLSHVRWDCKHHVAIIPKYRESNLYGKLRKHVGEVLREAIARYERALENSHTESHTAVG